MRYNAKRHEELLENETTFLLLDLIHEINQTHGIIIKDILEKNIGLEDVVDKLMEFTIKRDECWEKLGIIEGDSD